MAIRKDQDEVQGRGMGELLTTQQPQTQQEGQPQPQQESAVQQTTTPSRITSAQSSQQVQPMPKPQKAGTGTFANLKSYLQAAQGGGQQRVAQAAASQVQRLGAGAQKATQQAQKTFGTQMQAGSLAGMETAGQEAADIVKAARGVTYQAPSVNVLPENIPIEEQPAQRRMVTLPALPQPTIPEARINPPVQIPTQPQAPAQPQQYFTPEQTQRFADIINAQYQGPQSLQQAGLYDPAAQKARIAQQAGELTQTALGREQLLKDVFGRGRDYSRGASRLDALLLNASEQGVKQLRQQAQPALQSQQILQAAQNLSANEAMQRKAAIEQIRAEARGAFTGARTEEEQATEKRIDDLIKTPAVDESGKPIQKLDAKGNPVVDKEGKPVYLTEWERLPEYFRKSLQNKGATNKQIQKEQITELNKQYSPTVEKINSIPSLISKKEKDLKLAKEAEINAWFDGSGEAGIKKARDNYNKIQEDINNLRSEYTKIEASPEYKQYKKELDAVKGMNLNQWVLSPEEAAVLGIGAGEGLYNIRPEDIRTAQAERAKIITKDELSRQLALAKLAGTDISKELQKDLLYTDLEKAGTQDLASSLDTESFRKLLDQAQQGFETASKGANLTGTGSKKVSRGNIFGKKTKTYSASVGGNVADMLRQAGYDVNAESQEAVKSLLSNRDLLNRFLGATSTSKDVESNIGGSALEGATAGATTGASVGSLFGGIGAAPGAAVGAAIGGTIGSNTLDPIQSTTDLYKELEEKLGIKGLGTIGQGVQDIRSGAGGIISDAGDIAGSSVVGDIFRGIGGAVGGINTGAMKAYGSAIAKDLAIKDLQNKYAQFLKGQGFENRANIANTETTQARTSALLDLLRRQG